MNQPCYIGHGCLVFAFGERVNNAMPGKTQIRKCIMVSLNVPILSLIVGWYS